MSNTDKRLEYLEWLDEDIRRTHEEHTQHVKQTTDDAVQLLQEYVQLDADGEETTIQQANERARRADDIIHRLKYII